MSRPFALRAISRQRKAEKSNCACSCSATQPLARTAAKKCRRAADMLSGVMRRNGAVSVCGTCMDARGIRDDELAPGAKRGSMDQLTERSMWADKAFVF